MKQISKFNKINFILGALFSVLVLSTIIYFARNFFKVEVEMDNLIKKDFNGHLISLNDEGRGSYFLEIETKNENVTIHSLPIAWEIAEYRIQVGDSVSKSSNSKFIFFYRLRNGVYIKYCEFEI
jgi:hypothetical protein